MEDINEAIYQIEDGRTSKTIRLVHLSLSADVCTLLRDTLADNHCIETLKLYTCAISEIDLIQLALRLKDFGLVELNLTNVGMSEEVVIAIAAAIQKCSLKKLDVSSNHIGPKGAKYIALALRNCRLDTLHIADNSIHAEGAGYIAEVLAEGKTSLKELDVSFNRIGDEGCKKITEALPNTKLEALLMDTNEITRNSVFAVCEALKVCPQLLHLSLSENLNTNDSIEELTKVIPLANLKRLGLNHTRMTDAVWMRLGEAIQKSSTMVTLELDFNRGLTDAGAGAFLKLIKTHRTLRYVYLSESGVSDQMERRIFKHMANLHSVKSQILVSMVAAKHLPRFANERILPTDLLQLLKEML
jgi:Ran GTPase-activating protein (RanGAP) involved in mRNA processing and transport